MKKRISNEPWPFPSESNGLREYRRQREADAALDDFAAKLRRCAFGCFDYGQCKANMHGVPNECIVLRIAADTPAFSQNQCDGCAQNAQLRDNLHIDKDGHAFMVCQRERY